MTLVLTPLSLLMFTLLVALHLISHFVFLDIMAESNNWDEISLKTVGFQFSWCIFNRFPYVFIYIPLTLVNSCCWFTEKLELFRLFSLHIFRSSIHNYCFYVSYSGYLIK